MCNAVSTYLSREIHDALRLQAVNFLPIFSRMPFFAMAYLSPPPYANATYAKLALRSAQPVPGHS